MNTLWYVREPGGRLHGGYVYPHLARMAAQSVNAIVLDWETLVSEYFDGDEDAAQQAVFESTRERLAVD